MRYIRIDAEAIRLLLLGPGELLEVPVTVDWPELRLTDAQQVENAAALAAGRDRIHPDQQTFSVLLERPVSPPRKRAVSRVTRKK